MFFQLANYGLGGHYSRHYDYDQVIMHGAYNKVNGCVLKYTIHLHVCTYHIYYLYLCNICIHA